MKNIILLTLIVLGLSVGTALAIDIGIRNEDIASTISDENKTELELMGVENVTYNQSNDGDYVKLELIADYNLPTFEGLAALKRYKENCTSYVNDSLGNISDMCETHEKVYYTEEEMDDIVDNFVNEYLGKLAETNKKRRDIRNNTITPTRQGDVEI